MRTRWKGLLAGLALATFIGVVLGWHSRQFDYETGLRLMRLSWDGAHWGINGYGGRSVQPLRWFFADMAIFALVISAPAALILCPLGYVLGRYREDTRKKMRDS